MKYHLLRISIFICIILTVKLTHAQDFQGKAYYMSKTDADMSNFGRPDMDEEQKRRMAERLKSMLEKTYVLSFNKIESIYKVEEQLEAPTGGGRGGGFGAMMSGAMDGVKYKNVKTNLFLSEHELFGKLFLIKEDLQKLEWKMTGETKQVGAYTCFKATTIKTWNDFDMSAFSRRPPNRDENNEEEEKEPETTAPKEVEVVAWYTMQIPVNQGPGDFWGLPGLILEISTDKTTILCTKIILNPSEKFDIKQPSKGKEVTKEEYVEIATKKYEEMRDNFRRGGGGRPGGGGRR